MENLLKDIIKREKVFAIDISSGSLKVAEFEKKKDHYKLINIGEEELPASTFIAGIIRQPNAVIEKLNIILSKNNPKKIKTRFAVVIIPDDQIYSQIVKIPKVEFSKIEKAIQFQLTTLIPMKEDDIYWTYDVLSEDNENYEVIVTAVSKESADSFIDTLKLARITPLLFEGRAQSALRAITLNKENEDYLLLDMGKSVTNIAINKKDAIQFSTSFYFGLNQIVKTTGEYLKLNDDKINEYLEKNGINTKDSEFSKHIESLFTQVDQELKKALNFYGEEKIKKIYIYGETAALNGVIERIQEMTKVEVEKAKINIKVYPILQWEKHEQISPYVPIIGLELLNKVPSSTYINLLPKKQKSKTIQAYFLKFGFSALKFLLLNLVLLSLIFVFLTFIDNVDINGINTQISYYKTQIGNPKYKGVSTSIGNMNTQIATLAQTYRSQNKWSYVIAQISNLIPNGVFLNNIDITNVGKGSQAIWQITLQGDAQNQSQIIQLENNINTQTDFSKLSMPISNFESTINPGFTMIFNYNGSN